MSSRYAIHFRRSPVLFRNGERCIHNAPANVRELERKASEAFERGRAVGQHEAAAQLSSARTALAEAIRRAQSVLEQRFAELEPQVVDLVLEVAGAVICQEIERGRYDLEGIVRESLRGLRGLERDLEVHLHPQDYATLRDMGIDDGDGLHYVTDPAIPLAGCHVRTSYGTIVRETDELLGQIRGLFHELADSTGCAPPPADGEAP